MIAPALKTGKLTIVANAMAREVMTNDEGLATGVSYIDTQKLTEHQVRAKVVVVAASCCESARLLLNSKSTRHPGGLANSSGVRRQVPHRFDRAQRERLHSRAARHAALQPGRRRRHAPLRAVVGEQQGAGLPARLPHRARRRQRHARLRLRLAACRTIRRAAAAATARSSRTNTGATTAPTSASPAAANRWLARIATARSIRTSVDRVRHPGTALQPHVERPRAAAGQAHAGDLPRHHRGDGRDPDHRRCRRRSRTTAWRSAA